MEISRWYDVALLEPRNLDQSNKKEQTVSFERTPESFEDLNKKRVLTTEAPRFHGAAQLEERELSMLVDRLRKNELDFSNFSSPENLLGLATYLRWDGRTMTGEILEEVERMRMSSQTIRNSVDRLIFEVSSGKRWDEIMRVGQVQAFLNSPEGRLLIARADPSIAESQAIADYHLAKARMYRDRWGTHGAVIADRYYDKLRGTPYQEIAEAERRSLMSKVASGSKEVANSLLSLDQLAIMAGGGLVGKWLGVAVSRSEKLAVGANRWLTALGESRYAKALLPGIEVVAIQASDGKLQKWLKIASNITIDLGKFVAYERLAHATGNEDFAKTVAVLLAFLPTAKWAFEAQMKLHPSAKVEDALKYVEWLRKEKWDDVLRSELYEAIKRQEISAGRSLPPGSKEPVSTDGKDKILLANVDRMIQLSREVSEGTRIQRDKILERKYGNISETNPSTMDIYSKLKDFEWNTVKERVHPITKKVEKLTVEDYLPAFEEWLEKVGAIMQGVDNWAVMSSGTMYMSIPGYRSLPGDFDLTIGKADYGRIYEKLVGLEKNWEIAHLKRFQIAGKDKEDTKRVITDPAEIQRLLDAGNIRIAFVFPTKNGVLMDVELYAESQGKWLTQLGHMPRVLDTFTMKWKEIKTLGLFDLSEGYTINLMDEIAKNSIGKHGDKAKDATRIYNLTHYLRAVWLTDPSQLIPKIDQVVASYQKYGGGQLTSHLKGIFEKKEQVKEELWQIILEYKAIQRDIPEKRKPKALPEFQTFLEWWNAKKGELALIYNRILAGDISSTTLSEARKLIWEFQRDINQVKNSKIPHDQFAYFYEVSKVETEYLAKLSRLIKERYPSRP